MKKMIIAAAMFVTLSAFGNEEKVSSRVLYAFETEFIGAKAVEWTISADYYKASFDMNGQRVYAYYNNDGQLMGITRNISSTQLPVALQTTLKKNYTAYWISDLFEISNSDGTSYYVTLECSSRKIVLKASGGGDWITYQRDRKI